jgi:FKBP-type peptidyl-prolyl cis-trans isomerase
MRRIVLAVAIPLVGCAALAGCGSSGSSSGGNANAAVKVSGSFDSAPSVTIPKEAPSSKLVITTPIKGAGAELKAGYSALANVAVYKWSGSTNSLVDSTYTSGPQMIPAQMGLRGLSDALKNARMGSRIVAVVPPSYGYGKAGESQLGITASDTMVWVIDLLQQYSSSQSASGPQVSHGGGSLPTVSAKTGEAPVISIPKNSPPSKLSVTTLIKGSGPKLVDGDTVVAQYVGTIWRTGKVFSSTWPSSEEPDGLPFSFKLGGEVVTGWNDGLVGVPVGSRVMLVVPPALGYGPEGGYSQAGIEKNDTLVFVIDVLGVQPATS